MKTLKFKFKASPHSDFHVRVVFHETKAQLTKVAGGDVWGLCTCWAPGDNKNTVATIHFCREFVCVPVIAHEAFHAASAVIKNSRLTGTTEHTDEIFADTIEHIVDRIIRHAIEVGITLDMTEPV